ncbi:MAG: hypothetical protein M0Z93_02890 [Actinomycetota bacterium]|nr:hypothetical protein [Actinomycetota bacterium]
MLLRTGVVAVPLVVSGIVGVLVGLSIAGAGLGSMLLRLVLAGVASLCAFVGIERLARRFLPLATLLQLSLWFPDQAPSRFSVARRSSSVRKLQAWARTGDREDREEGLHELAEKAVTLATALNTHDRRTRGHSERTRAIADLDRGRAQAPGCRDACCAVGGLSPRRRQDLRAGRDPEQAGGSDRQRVGDAEAAPR